MAQCLQATGEMGLNLSTSRPLERRLLFMGRWGGVSLKRTLAPSKHLLHASSLILLAWWVTDQV